MSFDAGTEADKIEQLAKECLDEGDNDKAKDVGNKLAAEWLSMDQSQRNAVAAELQNKYDNLSLNSLPTPKLIRNGAGDVVEVDFRASTLDFSNGAHMIQLAEDPKPDWLTGKHGVSVFGLPNHFDDSGVWHAQVSPTPDIQSEAKPAASESPVMKSEEFTERTHQRLSELLKRHPELLDEKHLEKMFRAYSNETLESTWLPRH